jgi:hypothetical protein
MTIIEKGRQQDNGTLVNPTRRPSTEIGILHAAAFGGPKRFGMEYPELWNFPKHFPLSPR